MRVSVQIIQFVHLARAIEERAPATTTKLAKLWAQCESTIC